MRAFVPFSRFKIWLTQTEANGMAIHFTAHDGNMMLFPYLTNSVHQIFESFFIMHKTVCEDLANVLSARQHVLF